MPAASTALTNAVAVVPASVIVAEVDALVPGCVASRVNELPFVNVGLVALPVVVVIPVV